MTQPEFNFPRLRDTSTADRLRDQVLAVLGDGQWHLRRELCQRIEGLTERAARLIAEESRGVILGSDKGYKLQRYADSEEYFEWENRMRSQAKTMLRRIIQARRERNRTVAA